MQIIFRKYRLFNFFFKDSRIIAIPDRNSPPTNKQCFCSFPLFRSLFIFSTDPFIKNTIKKKLLIVWSGILPFLQWGGSAGTRDAIHSVCLIYFIWFWEEILHLFIKVYLKVWYDLYQGRDEQPMDTKGPAWGEDISLFLHQK